MNKLNIILFLFFVICYSLIVYGILIGQFTFGNGLGDWMRLGYFLVIFVAIVANGVVNFYKHESMKVSWIFISGFSLLLILNLTYIRGVEYKWNGDIFYYQDSTSTDNIQHSISR